MTNNQFLYGEFSYDEKDQGLHELAQQYLEETEAYDQLICSVKNDRGVAIPVDNHEFRLINKNALKVRNRLLKDNPSIHPSELHRVINKISDQVIK